MVRTSWPIVACVLVVASVGVGRAPAQQGGRWWKPAWRYRRGVTVKKVPPDRFRGSEVGVATFDTCGLAAADGRDIRVTRRAGGLTPHRVLQIGPGDRARVAFALHRGVKTYFIYFGNPKAPELEPTKQLDVRRGVLMECWEYVGGGLGDFAQADKTFARATKLIGRDFRPNVFIGHNPFGPQSHLCTRFTGWLVAPRGGEYTFAVSSRDGSFMRMDGGEVVSFPGRHGPRADAKFNASLKLKRGLHKMELLHVNTGGDPIIVAAWQAPGEKRIWPIPPDAFAPVMRAKVGPLKKSGQPLTADFGIDHAGEAFLANRYTQRFVFHQRMTEGRRRKVKVSWDFGDGQTATGGEVEHVYLSDGMYEVKMTASVGGKPYTQKNRLFVSRNWDHITLNEVDPLALHEEIVAGYDLGKLGDQDFPVAAIMFERADRPEVLMKLGDALVARESADGEALRLVLPKVVVAWRKAGKSARAVSALSKGVKMSEDPGVAAELMVLAGRVTLGDRNAPEAALELFNKAIQDYSALAITPAFRQAQIGIGDVWRLRGDYDKALAAYRKAPPTPHTSAMEAIRRGSLARHVEDYLRADKLNLAEEFLDTWNKELPVDRLVGYSTTMRVRLRIKQQRWADVVTEAEELVKVNRRSNYAPELLLHAVMAHEKLGHGDQATATLERLVDAYPESALAAEAKKRLEKPAR